jgi:energy-coupling factor transporter ATP-binding protein EcfA2
MTRLYTPAERKKLEWAIGSVVAGDAKDIQKFIVLYGEGGSGKSTFLNIVQKLFPGYYTTFEAKALTSASNTFSTEVFRNNPLVAIQHDGDLSKIEDNTKLNSIVSHEEMTMNEKYKPSYMARANCFLFMATNKPVRITDAKSGIIRRLIDVKPSGKILPTKQYWDLMSRLDFELGAIAHHCLGVYRKMGKNYYSTYRPLGMIFETDIFFNFVETNYYTFAKQDGVTLAQAWTMYKEFCEESLISFKLPRYKFRDELKNYFDSFSPQVTRVGDQLLRSYYSGFKLDKFKDKEDIIEEPPPGWLVLDHETSLFDELAAEYPAQYANAKYETPSKQWSKVKTVLSDIDTSKLHYVQLPENHIVIDFDIRDEEGNKAAELNLEAASRFPPTYGEFSKSQAGVHLHYIYAGDPEVLSRLYAEGIEVKVFKGDAALRRQLSRCNNIPVTKIKTGLPLKKKTMINPDVVQTENSIRELIKRNLRKEIHPGTKPSIDFIYKILEDAYASGVSYDVRDMRSAILAFATNSTHQAQYCVKLVSKMKFNSDEPSENMDNYADERLAFFDVEVFPNLFLVNWKYEGEENECIHMINPTSQEIEDLMRLKLIGFNCRRYDNHILYARYIGYDNKDLFELSSNIIGGKKRALFGEAYNISYTDVYDFSSKKQSLKKFQIELGINHLELAFPFDEPVPEKDWPLVIEYCDNDVRATEAVFHNREQDFIARQILADLSGMTVNDSTQQHTARILFGKDPNPQESFVYTDLSEMFPGYEFEAGKSLYQDEEPGEGGYVYSEPGFYTDVALLDIASMHPTSIVCLNLFGPYTDKYKEIIDARLAIKHKDFDKAKGMLGGVLEPYLTSVEKADDLAYALKIIINIVYGLTSARFANKFKDNRNIDNIVAKRGALFMIDLKHKVWDEGYSVAHIKTDSIKIPNPTKKIINVVQKFGKQYGYTFEHEATYDRFCLVNDAVYVARYADSGKWTATGAEFQHPFIFKTLFSKEEITFEDMCETKAVTTAMYLDMNEELGDEHDYVYVGKAGLFVPILPGRGGGLLFREKDGKYYAVSGTKGYRWLQAITVKDLGKEDDIDYSYYRGLVDSAVAHIEEFVSFDEFTK